MENTIYYEILTISSSNQTLSTLEELFGKNSVNGVSGRDSGEKFKELVKQSENINTLAGVTEAITELSSMVKGNSGKESAELLQRTNNLNNKIKSLENEAEITNIKHEKIKGKLNDGKKKLNSYKAKTPTITSNTENAITQQEGKKLRDDFQKLFSEAKSLSKEFSTLRDEVKDCYEEADSIMEDIQKKNTNLSKSLGGIVCSIIKSLQDLALNTTFGKNEAMKLKGNLTEELNKVKYHLMENDNNQDELDDKVDNCIKKIEDTLDKFLGGSDELTNETIKSIVGSLKDVNDLLRDLNSKWLI